MQATPKIVTNLWFDGTAEEAMNLYLSIFKNTKVLGVSRYGEEMRGVPGKVMTANFELEGHQFIALNGGPQYQFTPAIAFNVMCESQEEVDHYWYKLIADGGEEGPCGWLKDKFGVSWVIVPTVLSQLLSNPDPTKAQRVAQAMFQMKRIVIADLQRATEE